MRERRNILKSFYDLTIRGENKVKGWFIVVSLFVVLLFCSVPSFAGIPIVNEYSEVTITDVTPVSFSVIWKSSEASTSSLNVFNDSEGTVPTTNAVITSQPTLNGSLSIRQASEDNGVMKVMVTGLEHETVYYIQTVTTSKSTIETTIFPTVLPITAVYSVKTEKQVVRTSLGDTVPFSNDLILSELLGADQVSPSPGALLVLSVSGGSYPISSFIGDGVNTPLAYVDLNNLFDASTGETLNLVGGEKIEIIEFRGNCTTLYHYFFVPSDNDTAKLKAPDPVYFADNDGNKKVDILDVQRALNKFGISANDCEFNSDFDVVPDGTINILDIQSILNHFGESEPF